MQLFKVYLWMLQISLASFGGAYSIWALLIHDAGRDCQHGTLLPAQHSPVPVSACRDELQKLMGISELLPGPQVNAIAMTGYAEYGVTGMIIMVMGVITPGLVLIPFLLWLLRRHFSLVLVRAFFAGAGIATTAILAYFAFTLIRPFFYSQGGRSILLTICTLVALVLSFRFKMNPGLIVIIGAIFGYFLL